MENYDQIQREQVIGKLRDIAERGIRHPDQLDHSDPDVKQAEDLYFAYIEQRRARSKGVGTIAAELECSLEISTLEVDAGFTDPDYVDEVANDWLAQDEQSALDGGLPELAAKIQQKAEQLNNTLGQSY